MLPMDRKYAKAVRCVGMERAPVRSARWRYAMDSQANDGHAWGFRKYVGYFIGRLNAYLGGLGPRRFNVVFHCSVDFCSGNTKKLIDASVSHSIEMTASPVCCCPCDAVGVGVFVITVVRKSVVCLARDTCHDYRLLNSSHPQHIPLRTLKRCECSVREYTVLVCRFGTAKQL